MSRICFFAYNLALYVSLRLNVSHAVYLLFQLLLAVVTAVKFSCVMLSCMPQCLVVAFLL